MSNINNIEGDWEGVIVYGKEYRKYKGKELYFKLNIQQKEHLISGVSHDTGGIGISPDSAVFKGGYSHNKIVFIKQYNSCHYFKKGKTHIDKTKKGPLIEYKGEFNNETNKFEGDWVIKIKIKLFNIIPIFTFKNTGRWEMKRKQ